MKVTYKAVIFDADGTLVDTTQLVVRGYMETLERSGYSQYAAKEHVLRCVGGTVANSLAKMLNLNQESDEIKRLTEFHDTVQDAHPEWISSYPGVKDCLEQLRWSGIKVCLFTSGSLYQVNRNFKAVGIYPEEAFDFMVTADDDVGSKPSPEGLMLVMDKCGISRPSECIYVGDHGVDMQAGKSAGVGLAVGISHGLHDELSLTEAGADEIIHYVNEIFTFTRQVEF